MGERIVRNDEVAGSIPVISTTIKKNSFDTRKCIKAFFVLKAAIFATFSVFEPFVVKWHYI